LVDRIFKKFRNKSKKSMKFNLTIEDFTIIINALHYYKKVEKRDNFKKYDEKYINHLRDKMSYQMMHDN